MTADSECPTAEATIYATALKYKRIMCQGVRRDKVRAEVRR